MKISIVPNIRQVLDLKVYTFSDFLRKAIPIIKSLLRKKCFLQLRWQKFYTVCITIRCSNSVMVTKQIIIHPSHVKSYT